MTRPKENGPLATGRERGITTRLAENIIPFPPQEHNRYTCSSCGILFSPRASWHDLCRQCYRWTVAGEHIAIAAAALRGIG